ncbi:MAG: hypothetical protein WBM54_14730 [Woeseia sp.]
MTIPRAVQIDSSATPYYHCVSRCVRRAFLCGIDERTGYNFEHRRAWIEQRLHELAAIFAIDLCAYAVMSNHYHVVLHLNAEQLSAWDASEVVDRWQCLHRLPDAFEAMCPDRQADLVATWRERLSSISWFMKCLNEPLARLANKEDGCKGRFWEGRFRSQALLDEAAVIQCMAYVDLNPIRAGMAKTPEASDHTSVKARINGLPGALAPTADEQSNVFALPIALKSYLLLVDRTGRALRSGKRGRIDPELEPILRRLQQKDTATWLLDMRDLTRRYCRAIGSAVSLRNYRDHLGQARLNGVVG